MWQIYLGTPSYFLKTLMLPSTAGSLFSNFFLVSSLGGDLEQRNYTMQGGTRPPFADEICKVLFDSSSTIKNKEARKQVFGSVPYSLVHHLQTNFANPGLLRLCFTCFRKKYYRGKIVGSKVLTLGQLWGRSVLKHIAPKQATLLLHFKY